ncbi:UNVERIFIED_CONTAM: hypothetical protein RMT77_002940 [Armadillidium vulgare]
MSKSDENENPLLRVDQWSTTEYVDKSQLNGVMKKNLHEDSSIKCKDKAYDVEYFDKDVYCGFPEVIKPPTWLQRMGTKRTFLFVFCLSTVLQGMYYTYFVSVLTTIEKLFQIQSKTAGVIMSATEIGQIAGGLLLSYYGGCGHRPRWIASGMFLFGASASLSALPHFLFGDVVVKDFLASTPSQDNPLATANVCQYQTSVIEEDQLLSTFQNLSLVNKVLDHQPCDASNSYTRIVLGLLFVALLGVGVGQTAVYNLGVPYIDDNVASEESPTYFGITMGVRILGPTFGFLLGSFCTRLPIDPFSETKYDPADPRWVSAWWLGHVLISSGIILTSFIMMLFPKRLPTLSSEDDSTHLPKTNSFESGLLEEIYPLTKDSIYPDSSSYLTGAKPSKSEDMIYQKKDLHTYKLSPSSILHEDNPTKSFQRINNNPERCKDEKRRRSLTDFLDVLCRLVKNKILVLRTMSSVLHMLPISGLYTFLPKYIETQFRVPAHSAAMISGVGGILVMGFGIMASGIVIRKLSPPPRIISGWIAITAFLYSFGMVILMFLGCSHQDIQGRYSQISRFQPSHFVPICERNCTFCNAETFAPICSSEGKTYFSACHAGCRTVNYVNTTEEMLFSDCECLGEGVTARLRLCESQCSNLLWYIIVFCIFVIIHSTSEVGGMLITLRCVDPKDKVMALGLISVAIGLFANVPCPIIYGAVIDYACVHWRNSCDGRGACQIYDPDIFRTYFHGTTAIIMFLACIVDIFVWYCSKSLSLNDQSNLQINSTNATTSSIQSNAPTLVDKLETESTWSSSVSSQRKRESLCEEEEDDGDFGGGEGGKARRLSDEGSKEKTMKFQNRVTGYVLKESII